MEEAGCGLFPIAFSLNEQGALDMGACSDRLPGHQEPGPQHRGTIHINARMQDLEDAYYDAVSGRPSGRPIVEMTIPSAVDSSLAPAGQYVASMFVQYAPYHLRSTTWDEQRDAFGKRCIDLLARYAPNVPQAIEHCQVLTPLDLERTFRLTGGNIMQGAMHLHQLFFMRPVAGWSDHRSPVQGLYLCGAASQPGGGVIGACGRKASEEILRDFPV